MKAETTNQKPKKKLKIAPINFEATTEQARLATEKMFTQSRFEKPNSDYLRLDLVLRDVEKGINGNKPILSEKVLIDYKDYLATMAKYKETSMTKYVHGLIDSDMRKNKSLYEELKKKGCD